MASPLVSRNLISPTPVMKQLRLSPSDGTRDNVVLISMIIHDFKRHLVEVSVFKAVCETYSGFSSHLGDKFLCD